jgi:hypothetical protein
VLADSQSQNIVFNSTIDGEHSLAVNTRGNEEFNGRVGGNVPLTTLTTDDPTAPETLAISSGGPGPGGHAIINVPGSDHDNPSVLTVGSQTYYDNVQLGANTVLTTGGSGSVHFLGGSDSEGFLLVVNDINLTELSLDTERRILSTLAPKVKKGQAKRAEGSSGKAVEIPSLVPVERSYGEHFNNQQ